MTIRWQISLATAFVPLRFIYTRVSSPKHSPALTVLTMCSYHFISGGFAGMMDFSSLGEMLVSNELICLVVLFIKEVLIPFFYSFGVL